MYLLIHMKWDHHSFIHSSILSEHLQAHNICINSTMLSIVTNIDTGREKHWSWIFPRAYNLHSLDVKRVVEEQWLGAKKNTPQVFFSALVLYVISSRIWFFAMAPSLLSCVICVDKKKGSHVKPDTLREGLYGSLTNTGWKKPHRMIWN